ncbi:MAG TPA: 30S ribosomal protein S13, partial [Phycisphaerales bacterium]|nr:30S ribosomal protein S13 [Phycisphaerales bacterium]
MPRIAGVDIPENKKIRYSLRYIYGIGPQTADDIIAETGINPDTKAKDLSETEVGQIIACIEAGIQVEGTLRRQ